MSIAAACQRAREHLHARREARLSPVRQRANDFFLVEFPKSGVTWLSLLLANAFLAQRGGTETATFASVRCYIPDLHVNRHCEAVPLGPSGQAFYKSHVSSNGRFVHTIYLARHPVAVMRSYYRYCLSRELFEGSLAAFVEHPRRGVPAWREHVRSWLTGNRDSDRHFVHLVRYEELVAGTTATLGGLSRNFGWDLSEASLDEAERRSSRETMLAQEQLYRQHNPNHRMQFVASKAHDDMEPRLAQSIADQCGEELTLLGYAD